MSSSNLVGCSSSASQNAPRLLRSKSSLVFQLSLSQSVNRISRYLNSASHSCFQSQRSLLGTITPMTRISHSQKRKRVVAVDLDICLHFCVFILSALAVTGAVLKSNRRSSRGVSPRF